MKPTPKKVTVKLEELLAVIVLVVLQLPFIFGWAIWLGLKAIYKSIYEDSMYVKKQVLQIWKE